MARDLRNPIISKDGGDFVPNHADLGGARLTFVTPPNLPLSGEVSRLPP